MILGTRKLLYFCTIIFAFAKNYGMGCHILKMYHWTFFIFIQELQHGIVSLYRTLWPYTMPWRIHKVQCRLCKMVSGPHWIIKAFDFLQEYFDECIIVLHFTNHTGTSMDWHLYLPHLYPCDFFLWRYMKEEMYQKK